MYSFFLSALLLFFLTPPVFTEEPKINTNNAAYIYIDTWKMIPIIDWVKLDKDYQEVRTLSWNRKYPELEKLLQKNTALLSNFKKASSVDFCDFFANIDLKKMDEYKLPISLDKFRTFFKLIILNIRKLEADNKSDEAFDLALRLLKFSSQISSVPTPPSFLIYGKGLLIRKELFEYFSTAAEKNQKIKENIKAIEDYSLKGYTMENIIESECALTEYKLKAMFKNEKALVDFLSAHNIDSSLNKEDILNKVEQILQTIHQRLIKAAREENIGELQNIRDEILIKYPESYEKKLNTVDEAAKAFISVSVLPWKASFENDSNVRLKYKQLIVDLKRKN